MRVTAVLAATLGLAACVSGNAEPPPLQPLAEDIDQPALALFEHVLTAHFVGLGASPPTTCAALRPDGLDDREERQLLERFVRLSSASRCVAGDAVVEVYDFACTSETVCSGWTVRPGAPATRYAMRFRDGAWHVAGDLRILAE